MITKISDQPNLVPTSQYPYAKFKFDNFNPVQSRVFEFYDKDVNSIIAASTSAGKTVTAEMIMSHEIRKNKKKAIYLSPLKALAQERVDDWQENHFCTLKTAICTGDYRLTYDRRNEMEEADIIIMTYEMLNSRCRNYKIEANNFLKDIGVLICDESHSIGMDSRGPVLESAIMKFTEVNPDARIVFLSATLPNVEEVGKWLSSLNGKETYVLESTYRPCPLKYHYVKYLDEWNYEDNEKAKVAEAIDILKGYPEDKFIIFVHTKKTGEMLFNDLKKRGIQAEYHNADLPKDKRINVEKRFREDPKLRCLVATSGLSQGLNMPSRRVIVLGVHRGLSEVDTFSIIQMAGRAGRPQYDKEGDVYIILPTRGFQKHKDRLQVMPDIRSQFLDEDCLAFHLISEIHHGSIRTSEDVHKWYRRSLSHHQDNSLDDSVVDNVIEKLSRCGAVMDKGGEYFVTSVGTVASMFYMSPFDVSDLLKNWNKIFSSGKDGNDYWVSVALANVANNRLNITSAAEREEMDKFRTSLEKTTCQKVMGGEKGFTDGVLKCACAYYKLLKGDTDPSPLSAVQRGLQNDCERLTEVLGVLDQMSGKWGMKEYFRRLHLRLMYGVPADMVDLCRLKTIGRAKSRKLFDGGLKTLEQVSKDVLGIIKALNCSKIVAESIAKDARELSHSLDSM